MDIDRVGSLMGNFGEFFGSIAVVATLIYLALQVRQNSQALRIGARQHVLDRLSDGIRHIVSEPDTRAVITKAFNQIDDLTQDERVHFNHLMMLFSNNFYDALMLHRDSDLNDDAFNLVANAYIGSCATPGGNAWWKQMSEAAGDTGVNFPPEFINYVNRRIEEDTGAGKTVGTVWQI